MDILLLHLELTVEEEVKGFKQRCKLLHMLATAVIHLL